MNYSVILHGVRRQFELTMNEYAVADLIYHLSNNPQVKDVGYCMAAKTKLADLLGISGPTLWRIMKTLQTKGLVEINTQDSRLTRTTQRWYDAVISGSQAYQNDRPGLSNREARPIKLIHPSYNKTYNKTYSSKEVSKDTSSAFAEIQDLKSEKLDTNPELTASPLSPERQARPPAPPLPQEGPRTAKKGSSLHPDQPKVLAHIRDSFFAKNGVSYPFKGEDILVIKRMLANFPLFAIFALWDVFMETNWNYKAKDGQIVVVPHTLRVFGSKVPILLEGKTWHAKREGYERMNRREGYEGVEVQFKEI